MPRLPVSPLSSSSSSAGEWKHRLVIILVVLSFSTITKKQQQNADRSAAIKSPAVTDSGDSTRPYERKHALRYSEPVPSNICNHNKSTLARRLGPRLLVANAQEVTCNPRGGAQAPLCVVIFPFWNLGCVLWSHFLVLYDWVYDWITTFLTPHLLCTSHTHLHTLPT